MTKLNVLLSRGFDELRAGAQFRLSTFRARAARISRPASPPTWRAARYRKLSEPYPQASMGYIESRRGARIPIIGAFDRAHLPVRGVEYCDEVDGVRIGHRGWYADAEGYGDRGKVRGIVGMLSHGRFLRGYEWDDNGESVLYCDTVYSDLRQCASDADHEAEKYADSLREDDERFRAMVDAESLVESKESDLRAAWCAFLTDPRRHAATTRKARDWVRELIEDIRAARREYADAREAYERG